jgi:hypothetical protein
LLLYGITLAWASRITGAIGNVVGVGSNLVVQSADEAAVVARVVPCLRVIASDAAHALTRLILRGGMLANIVVVARLLGDHRSKAVRVVWPALLLCLGGAWLTLTIRGVGQSGADSERHHKQNQQHQYASKATPPFQLSTLGGLPSRGATKAAGDEFPMN